MSLKCHWSAGSTELIAPIYTTRAEVVQGGVGEQKGQVFTTGDCLRNFTPPPPYPSATFPIYPVVTDELQFLPQEKINLEHCEYYVQRVG